MKWSEKDFRRSLREEVGEAVRRELEMGIDAGTATGGTDTTLEDTSKDWGTNAFARAYVEITDGTGKGQMREIDSNTGTVLTAVTAWTTTPDETSDYRVFGAPAVLRAIQSEQPRGVASWGGTAITGRDITTDLADLPDILAKLDISVGNLRDALRGMDARTLTNLYAELRNITPAATSYEATDADTEYSFDLPAGTRRFTIKARGGRIDIGFVSGERPIQIADGGAYWEDMLDLPDARTVYYLSPTAGTVAEVLYWT